MDRFDHVINLPDLQFSQFCQHQFSLNKGVYNTIDAWFFNNGIVDIIVRRKMILQFMNFSCSDDTKIKFGSGGLSKKLEDFWNQTIGEIFVN